MLTQKGRRQEPTPTRHTVRHSIQTVAQCLNTTADHCRLHVAETGVSEALPRVRILTTLYDLVETMQSSMSSDEENLVVTTIVSLLDSSRIKFLRAPDHIKNASN